jgi:hypothetical protein
MLARQARYEEFKKRQRELIKQKKKAEWNLELISRKQNPTPKLIPGRLLRAEELERRNNENG